MKKVLFLTITLISFLSILVSCGTSEPANDNIIWLEEVDELEKYVIVYTENNQSSFANALRDEIESTLGVSLKIAPAKENNVHEILIGNTIRKESSEALKKLSYFDYTVKKVNGKIIIAGGSDDTLDDILELFKREFIIKERNGLYIPSGEGYTYIHDYPVDALSVDGIDISEFKIYNKSYLEEAEIASRLFSSVKCDHIFAKEMTEGEHYIVIDAGNYIYEDYSVEIKDGNIILRGSARSIYAALDYFTKELLAGLDKNEYDLTSADNIEGKIEKKEIYSKDQLMAVLEEVYNDPYKMIIGEQGGSKSPETVRNAIASFERATGGQKPGILGFDLEYHTSGLLTKSEAYEISSIVCDLVDYAADGGILTFSAHWTNPSGNFSDHPTKGNLGYDNSLEGYEKAFTELLTEGTEYNEKFTEELDREVDFFLALKANGVPSIWRPLHEANATWFWFGATQGGKTLDASYVKNIWYYVYDYFAEKGIDNLLWCFAPNVSSNSGDAPGTTMSTTYLYPGDEYCDMVGVDWYTQGELEITEGKCYSMLIDSSKKIGALTEFGPTGKAMGDDGAASPDKYNSMNVYKDIMTLIDDGYSFSYLLTWGSRWGFEKMGMGKEFMEQELTLGQVEVKAIFGSLK
ncbi:MAG: hypothetical protein IKJ91_07315 [Clostridia bacterium]|nr:hypothetical protein [Clostridia bacterium]